MESKKHDGNVTEKVLIALQKIDNGAQRAIDRLQLYAKIPENNSSDLLHIHNLSIQCYAFKFWSLYWQLPRSERERKLPSYVHFHVQTNTPIKIIREWNNGVGNLLEQLNKLEYVYQRSQVQQRHLSVAPQRTDTVRMNKKLWNQRKQLKDYTTQ